MNLRRAREEMEWISSLFLLHFSTIGIALNDCNNCECCEGGLTRCQLYASVSDYCKNGCIDGFYGSRCTHACPSNCQTCSSESFCSNCISGYYGSNCNKCPDNCISCSSATICTACQDGFFNGRKYNYFHVRYEKDCRNACTYNCKSCTSYSTCNECKDGFYNGKQYLNSSLQYTDCRHLCRSSCKSCTSYDTCVKCVDGKYNDNYKDCRESCNLVCKACTTYNNCTSCKAGKYGSSCQHDCGLGCKYHQCDFNNGSCICISNFQGSKCDQCVTGRYGYKCDSLCPVGCANNLCNNNGVCYGCRANHYGEQCNMSCATTCLPDDKGRRCLYTNGSCVKDCQNGYHGDMCQDRCSENCIKNSCSRANGTCKLGCVEGFERYDCTKPASEVRADSYNTADFSIAGAFIGTGVGSVAVTLVAVGIFIIIRRYLRHRHERRNTLEQPHELTAPRLENVGTNNASMNMPSVIDSGYTNTAFPVYEELKETTCNKDSNTYDCICDADFNSAE